MQVDVESVDERGESPASSAQSADLELRAVTKYFGNVKVVDEVSLTIAAGTFVTLLGASGCGKTTTLKMIMGLEKPSAGKILVGDRDITGLPPYRRNLGMVYQNYALFPHMTVAENIAFPLRMRRIPQDVIHDRVREVLELVQLTGFEGRLPQQLSGGQQQRVALVRALVFRPPILLLDEPLAALDRKLRAELQGEIKRIQRDLKVTVLNVTHDQEEALTVSDAIVVMNAGRVEQAGSPQDIYERPVNRFVADFMGATNLIAGTVVSSDPVTMVRSARGAALPGTVVRSWRPGDQVVLVIRPECIQFVRPSHPVHWSCAGQIVETTYVGGLRQYRVVLHGGDQLNVSEPNVGAAIYSKGSSVEIFWESRNAWIMSHH